MDNTSIPPFEAVPFASGATSGYRNTIPVTPSGTPGAASYTAGFPPETFQPIASGGIPPSGADFNGALFDLSEAVRWEQAGGQYPFDATFAGTIGGYPKGAIVLRADGSGQWLNTTNNNSTDPDSGTAAGWIALRANTGRSTIAASVGANVPTPTQLGAQVLVVTGSIASAATLVLPLTAGSIYVVRNNTTGAGTLTVIGATGSGVTIPQTVGYFVYTDGTNFYGTSADVSGLYLPMDGTAVAATKLASARTFSISGGVTATGVSFDGTGNVVLNVTAIPGNAATATKWASSITLSLAGITTGTASIDGSGNVTLNTAIADGALSIAKTNGLQATLDSKLSLSGGTLIGITRITGQSLFSVRGGTDARITFEDSSGARRALVGSTPSAGTFALVNYAADGSTSSSFTLSSGVAAVVGSFSASGTITSPGGFQIG